jgi:hypothetical protein
MIDFLNGVECLEEAMAQVINRHVKEGYEKGREGKGGVGERGRRGDIGLSS